MGVISILVASELILPEIRTRQCRVPTIDRGRETALPSPRLSLQSIAVGKRHCRVLYIITIDRGRETALPCPRLSLLINSVECQCTTVRDTYAGCKD